MEFNDYQEKANSLAVYLDGLKEKYSEYKIPKELWNLFGVSYASLGLGEVGEIQNRVKKIIRDSNGEITDETRETIIKELGDVLWYVAAMCMELNIPMDYVAQKNLNKLFSRRDRGVLHGSGDNR
jgi:NTP pyrophosphatase (non-canonical NTP hydrolase)